MSQGEGLEMIGTSQGRYSGLTILVLSLAHSRAASRASRNTFNAVVIPSKNGLHIKFSKLLRKYFPENYFS